MRYTVHQQHLIEAWEHNTQKIMGLLEHTLILRVQIEQAINQKQFSDREFIDSLENNLMQLKAVTGA